MEGILPGCVEVDGVSKDKAGQCVNQTLRNQVFDPTLCLLTDPVVDGDARLFWCACEIEDSEPSTIVLSQQVKECGKELIVFPLLLQDGL